MDARSANLVGTGFALFTYREASAPQRPPQLLPLFPLFDGFLLRQLIMSKKHEDRLLAVFVLAFQFEKAGFSLQESLVEFYLSHVNNWDLVDDSAPKTLGNWLLNKDQAILFRLIFLDLYYPQMPRTCLRYAIEKFPEPLRLAYLQGTRAT